MGTTLSATSAQICENIATMLFRARMSQRDLSRVTGLSQTTVSHKLRGRNSWTINDLERIGAALSVSVPELVGDLPDRETWEIRHTDG